MKIDNLYVGLVAKNYKSLCEILEDKYNSGGKAKELQMKLWACYFNAKRDGQKIIITEIYETHKPLPQHGGARNVITYLDIVKQLMIQILLCSDSKSIIIAKNSFLVELNMINTNYKECKQYIPSLSQHLNIDQRDVSEFYNSADGMLKRNIEKALDQLESNAHILYDKITMVNKNGEIRPSTDDERDLILEVFGNILTEMGFDNPNGVIQAGKYEEYINKVNKQLFALDGIRYIYKAYSISLNHQRLENELAKMEKEDKITEELKLNAQIRDRIKNTTFKRRERALVKDAEELFFSTLTFNEKRRVSESYIENHNKLTDVLINTEHESIVDDVKKLSRHKG